MEHVVWFHRVIWVFCVIFAMIVIKQSRIIPVKNNWTVTVGWNSKRLQENFFVLIFHLIYSSCGLRSHVDYTGVSQTLPLNVSLQTSSHRGRLECPTVNSSWRWAGVMIDEWPSYGGSEASCITHTLPGLNSQPLIVHRYYWGLILH